MNDKEQVVHLWRLENAACVIGKGERLRLSHRAGIRPLLDWLEQEPEAFRGGAAADRVVGRAAALLFVYGGIRAVHAAVVSDGGRAVLEQAGIDLTFDEQTAYIRNRQGTGMCPMEASVQDITDPAEALAALRRTAEQLAAGSAAQQKGTL